MLLPEDNAGGGAGNTDPNSKGNSVLGDAGKEGGVQDKPASDKPDPKAGDTQDWRSGVAADLRDLPEVKRYKTLDAMVKGHVEQSKFVGGSIRIPAADAKQEEWDKVYEKLGRPAKPEEYKFNIPAGAESYVDKAGQESFAKGAHAVGMTQKQIDFSVKWQGERILAAQAEIGGSYAETKKALQEEYGGAYERNLGIAQRFVREMGGKELLDYLDVTGLGNHPALVKAFVKAGALLVEDGVIHDDIEGQVGPKAAIDEIDAIMGDKQHAYWKVDDPGHKAAVEHMKQLHDIAYPNS